MVFALLEALAPRHTAGDLSVRPWEVFDLVVVDLSVCLSTIVRKILHVADGMDQTSDAIEFIDSEDIIEIAVH